MIASVSEAGGGEDDAMLLTFLVVVELLQELEQFVPVPPQYALYLWWLLRVGDEHLQLTLESHLRTDGECEGAP